MASTSRSHKPRPTLGRILFSLIAVITLMAAGAGATWVLLHPSTPADLTKGAPATTAPVEPQDYTDSRNVTLNVVKAPPSKLRADTEGTLTRYNCTPSGTWSTGTSPVSVDSAPLLALHTEVPLWRDLSYGDNGEDVVALQRALINLGYSLNDDGEFGWYTWDAYRNALKNIDVKAPQNTFSTSTVLWLPADTVTLSSCPAQADDAVSKELVLAEAGGNLSSVSIQNMPTDLIAGPRHLTVAGATVPVEENGQITDPAAVATLAATSISTFDPEKNGDLYATLELDASTIVYSLPVGAVGDPAGEAFVTSQGTRYPVSVVASSLGRTLVMFTGAGITPPTMVDTTPDEAAA